MEIQDFREQLRKKLRYQKYTFDLRVFSDDSLMTQEAADHPQRIIDRYVIEFGYTALGDDWMLVSEREGKRLL